MFLSPQQAHSAKLLSVCLSIPCRGSKRCALELRLYYGTLIGRPYAEVEYVGQNRRMATGRVQTGKNLNVVNVSKTTRDTAATLLNAVMGNRLN